VAVRDFLTYVRLSARVMLRNDAWMIAIPIFAAVVVGWWTLYFTETANWRPWFAVAQAEVFGPFLAALLFAGLLDPEHRRQAGEIVFSKPHPPALLLGVRIGLALFACLGLLLALLLIYRFCYGNVPVLSALAHAAPPCLFIGAVALMAGQSARSVAVGYAVPLAFWAWDTTGGLLYNPLLALPVGAMDAEMPAGSPAFISVPATKVTMLVMAGLLFWVNVRRLRKVV
jgi:hypothetical protein